MTSVQSNGLIVTRALSPAKKAAVGLAGLGSAAYDVRQQQGNSKYSQCGPVTGAIFYWGTKIGLWTLTVVTAGQAVKTGAKSLQDYANAGSSSSISAGAKVADTAIKYQAANAMTNCASTIGQDALVWAGGEAAAKTVGGIGVGVLAEAVKEIPGGIEFAEAATVSTAMAATNTVVTAKTVVVGAASAYAAAIESASVSAGAVGTAIPFLP